MDIAQIKEIGKELSSFAEIVGSKYPEPLPRLWSNLGQARGN